MEDFELLKTELAVHGIVVSDAGTCSSVRNGEYVQCSVEEELEHLSNAVRENKKMVRELWREIVQFLSEQQHGFPSSEVTQKMFVNTVKMLNRAARRFRSLGFARNTIRTILNTDSTAYGESFMAKAIEYGMGFAWVHHLISHDLYRARLLRHFTQQQKFAASGAGSYGTNAGGMYGTFPLEMRERVWGFDEDRDRADEKESDPVAQFWNKRHQLPETYNDPFNFEEGFVWRDIRNDPYEFGDEDEDPYPHQWS